MPSSTHINAFSVTRSHCSLPSLFALSLGGTISNGKIGYSLYGDPTRPAILVLGGISAGRDIAVRTDCYAAGWWSSFVGEDKAINTNTNCIIGIDYIGGNGISSAPDGPFGVAQGAVTTFDQANAITHLLRFLNISKLHAVVGASYGGMVALALLQHFPVCVSRGLIISAADCANPYGTAIRFVQRQIVQQDPCSSSLQLARALAMVSYRSEKEFSERFGNHPEYTDEGFTTDTTNYILARGAEFAYAFDPYAFLRLSESIDLHRVDPTRINRPMHCIAVNSDQIIPPHTIQRMADLAAASCQVIDSVYGHDAFLKEHRQIDLIVRQFLNKEH